MCNAIKPSLLKSYHYVIVSKAEGDIDQKAKVYIIQARCTLTKTLMVYTGVSYNHWHINFNKKCAVYTVVINCMTSVLHEQTMQYM